MAKQRFIKQDIVDVWKKIRIGMAIVVAISGALHILILPTLSVRLTMALLYVLCVLFCLRFVSCREMEIGLWGFVIGIVASFCFYMAGWPEKGLSTYRFFFMGIVSGYSFVLLTKSIVNMTTIAE